MPEQNLVPSAKKDIKQDEFKTIPRASIKLTINLEWEKSFTALQKITKYRGREREGLKPVIYT